MLKNHHLRVSSTFTCKTELEDGRRHPRVDVDVFATTYLNLQGGPKIGTNFCTP